MTQQWEYLRVVRMSRAPDVGEDNPPDSSGDSSALPPVEWESKVQVFYGPESEPRHRPGDTLPHHLLDELGAEGWELATQTQYGTPTFDETTWTFKRPIDTA